MESKYSITSFFTANTHFFPNDSIGAIMKAFEKLSEQSISIFVSCCKFKNPHIILLISIFFGAFGIDRFIIGNIRSGIQKLICSIINIIVYTVFIFNRKDFFGNAINENVLFFIIIFSSIMLLIFWIIDICIITENTKKANLKVLARNFYDYLDEDIFNNYFDYKNTENINCHCKDEKELKEKLKISQEKISDLENKLKVREQQVIEIAGKMKKSGIENKWICEITGLSLKEIENLVV